VSGRLPRENGYLALMMPLAPHPENKNAVIAINLQADPRPLLELDVEAIRDRLFTAAEQLPDGVARIPLKAIHLNRSPVVGTPSLLDAAAARRLKIDVATCEKHWRLLHSADLGAKLAAVFAHQVKADERDAELALYQGFLPDADRALLTRVRTAAAGELTEKAFPFRDKRYHELLFRYRARHYPATLSPAEQARWQAHCRQRLTDQSQGFLTLAAYGDELDRLERRDDLPPRDKKLLESLRQWGARVAQLAVAG